MGPKVGFKPGGDSHSLGAPPPDYFSYQACGNCHSSSPTPGDVDKDRFYPSPSPCPTEVFWHDSLRSPQAWIQATPYRQSQNYLESYLQSRQDQFPLQLEDASLEFFLETQESQTLPVQVPWISGGKHGVDLLSGGLACAGPWLDREETTPSCKGIPFDFSKEGIGIRLDNNDLLSAKDFQVELSGIMGSLLTGVDLHSITVRQGRLIVTGRLHDGFINAIASGIARKPNPYDPHLLDFDLTDMVLKKIPVAYDSNSGKTLNYEQMLQEKDLSSWKVLPYFLSFAKQGRFPDLLSFNSVFSDALELFQHLPKSEGGNASSDAWFKLLNGLIVRSSLKPLRIVTKNLFADFAEETDKNRFQITFVNKNDEDKVLSVTAPLELNRLYVPGIIDVAHLSAEIEAQLHRDQSSEIAIHNLDIDLNPVDFLAGDGTAPGKIAVLGGKIQTGTLEDYLGAVPSTPALLIRGQLDHGFEVQLNLSLIDLRLRLPFFGEVTISGDLRGKLQIVPDVEVVQDSSGEWREKRNWKIDPKSLDLHLDNFDLKTAKGVAWKGASFQLSDSDYNLGLVTNSIESLILVHMDIPKILNSSWQSSTIDSALRALKDPRGFYDLAEILKNPHLQFQASGIKASGDTESWNFDLQGKQGDLKQDYEVRLNASGYSPKDKKSSEIVDDLKAHLGLSGDTQDRTVTLDVSAKQVALGPVQLFGPKLKTNLNIETSDLGAVRVTVPKFDLQANGTGAKSPSKGILRGPIWLKSKTSWKNPLTIAMNPATHELHFKNLNFSLGALQIHPSQLYAASRGKLSAFDIDGSLTGHWKMNLETLRGYGFVSLRGDGEGDIHLRDAKGLRLAKPDPADPTTLVETPIFSNTQWSVSRIYGIDKQNKRINGSFSLVTEIDPAAARVFGIIFDSGKIAEWSMKHDHLPYSAEGFKIKQSEYRRLKLIEEQKEEVKP